MKTPIKQLKLNIMGGAANPAPPIGPALGQAKVNIGEFVTRFNEGTKDRRGETVPVVVSVYEDKTFDLTFKTAPATSLILKAVGKDKGAGKVGTQKLGSISKKQLQEIAEKKISDLNTDSIDSAMKTVAGSAKSMGVEIK